MPEEEINEIMNILTCSETHDRLEMLGSGAYGEVYKVTTRNGYDYAVKECNLGYSSRPEFPDEYVHDAHILKELQGNECFSKLFFYMEGVMRLKGSEHYSTELFMLMVTPMVKGKTISKVMNSTRKECYEMVHKLDNHIIDALEESLTYSLKKGIIPADLHQHNIMFDMEKKMVIIVDVGNFEVPNNNANHNSHFQYDNFSAHRGSRNLVSEIKDSLRTIEENAESYVKNNKIVV
jgi:serine/threonine protein kinase